VDPEEEASGERTPDSAARDAWTALAEDLASLRGRDALPPWWDDFEGGELRDADLTILVPNSSAANHLNDNFGEDLSRLWRERAGGDAVVRVAIDLSSSMRAPLRGTA
jgi:chromosomal replication initiation ATPase DnaA